MSVDQYLDKYSTVINHTANACSRSTIGFDRENEPLTVHTTKSVARYHINQIQKTPPLDLLGRDAS